MPLNNNPYGKANIKPQEVVVGQVTTLTLIYTVGSKGIAAGGGIRITVRGRGLWPQIQTSDPTGEGYVTARASNGVPVRVSCDVEWTSHTVTAVVKDSPLQSGDTILLGIVEYPVGPFGHEGTGEVVEVGPGVRDLKPGDRVAGCGRSKRLY